MQLKYTGGMDVIVYPEGHAPVYVSPGQVVDLPDHAVMNPDEWVPVSPDTAATADPAPVAPEAPAEPDTAAQAPTPEA